MLCALLSFTLQSSPAAAPACSSCHHSKQAATCMAQLQCMSSLAWGALLKYSRACVWCTCRGEGWGRPAMEAMAMARPVITTNWSGPTAYINAEVGYPLEVEALTAASADMHSTNLDAQSWNEYFAGQRWAQPSVKHLRQLMRQVRGSLAWCDRE